MNAPTFEEDFRFVFAKSGKARAPRSGSSKPGGGSTGAGGGAKPTAAAMRGKLMNAVSAKPQVMVKITSFGKSSQTVKDHMDYISRKGENDVFDATGENLSEFAERAGLETREALAGIAQDLADAQEATRGEGTEQAGVRRRERLTMNLMLSMPAGTDTGAFELATRDFLSEQFKDREHVFTFHDDKGHYHAHIVVGLKSDDGKWLNPRKADLQEWREHFAESLEARGIDAQATPAYSRGRGKSGYRRDIEEPRKRGTGRRAGRSPSYDAEAEAGAIQARAAAWSRIGEHYARAGDTELAQSIKEYVADRFDYHPTPTPAPAPVEALEPTKAPAQAEAVPVTASNATRVSEAFADLAMKREGRKNGYRDNNDLWRFDTPAPLRAKVDAYNNLPKEQQTAELARIAADPQTAELLKQRTREQGRSR